MKRGVNLWDSKPQEVGKIEPRAATLMLQGIKQLGHQRSGMVFYPFMGFATLQGLALSGACTSCRLLAWSAKRFDSA